jgi:aminoglycoside phosphotransferase (APT) family kinase protein
VILTKLAGLPIGDYETWHGCPYDGAQFGAILAKLHAVTVSGYGPVDDFGRTYFPTWSAFLEAVARRALATCKTRASISPELATCLRERWYPRLAEVQLERPALLHLESLGFANLLYDPTLHSITGLLDYEDCIGGDPLFELTWMSYYYGDRGQPGSAFNYQRFAEGYGPWPGDDWRERLYRALMYLEKLAWIDPHGARATNHRQVLAVITRQLWSHTGIKTWWISEPDQAGRSPPDSERRPFPKRR